MHKIEYSGFIFLFSSFLTLFPFRPPVLHICLFISDFRPFPVQFSLAAPDTKVLRRFYVVIYYTRTQMTCPRKYTYILLIFIIPVLYLSIYSCIPYSLPLPFFRLFPSFLCNSCSKVCYDRNIGLSEYY